MIEVIIKDGFYISGNLSDELRKQIEEDLTYPNPKYAQVKKYSKYATTRVPKTLEYYQYYRQGSKLVLRVPIGYTKFFTYLDSEVEITDYRKLRKQIDFPKFSLELRETQEMALQAYLKNNKDLYCRGSIELPTGKGKTILGLALASILKTKTLIIVHTTDLVNGWKADIEKAFSGKAKVGLIQSKKREVGSHFTIATIQTLNRLSTEELNTLYTTFGLIIQDEMHHCPSTSFSLADNFMPRYRLGLSATPERSDGLAHVMQLYYGDFCYQYKVDPEKEKDILPVEVRLKNVDLYFNPVCTYEHNEYVFKGDLKSPKNFNPDYLPKNDEDRIRDISFNLRPKITYMEADSVIINHEKVVEQILQDIISEFNQGHSCLVFFTQVEDLLKYNDYLLSRKIPQECIGLFYGGNSASEQVKQIAENQRKYITLATYAKAKEGTNVRQWEVCFLVSSINDAKNVEQVLGRIRRTVEEGREKIDPVVVYDYGYNDCYPMFKHRSTRLIRYNKLKCKISGGYQKPKLFSRGF